MWLSNRVYSLLAQDLDSYTCRASVEEKEEVYLSEVQGWEETLESSNVLVLGSLRFPYELEQCPLSGHGLYLSEYELSPFYEVF